MFKKNAIFSLVSTTAMLLLPLTQAESSRHPNGIWTCENIRGSEKNLLIDSSAGFECVFKGTGGSEEKYKGEARHCPRPGPELDEGKHHCLCGDGSGWRRIAAR